MWNEVLGCKLYAWRGMGDMSKRASDLEILSRPYYKLGLARSQQTRNFTTSDEIQRWDQMHLYVRTINFLFRRKFQAIKRRISQRLKFFLIK